MSIAKAIGNTFFHKENLKKMGFKWNLVEKRWEIESDYVKPDIIEYFKANPRHENFVHLIEKFERHNKLYIIKDEPFYEQTKRQQLKEQIQQIQ
jgi:hypothetical protein